MKKTVALLLILVLCLSSCKVADEEKAYIDETIAATETEKKDDSEQEAELVDEQAVDKKEQSKENTFENENKVDTSDEYNSNETEIADNTLQSEVQSDDITEIRKVDFENLPIGGPVEIESDPIISGGYKTLDEYIPTLPEDCLIVRGIKEEQSTQYITKNGIHFIDWHSETPIKVTEVLSGNAKAGDTLLLYERAVVVEWGGQDSLMCDKAIPPVKKNTEYILFLRKYDNYSTEEKTVYFLTDMNCWKYEITDEIKAAKSADQLDLSDLEKEVYNRYYYKTN